MPEEGRENTDYSFSDGGFGVFKIEWLCAGWFGGYRVWRDIESLVEEVLREQCVFTWTCSYMDGTCSTVLVGVHTA